MSEIVTVALDRIRLNDYNPNAMDAEIFRALLSGMKEGGLEDIDPILLRPLEEATVADADAVAVAEPAEPSYEVVDGEHRTRVARLLKWTEIRARIQNLGLEEAMVVNYRKNRERGRLDPVKEGKLFKWWRDEKGLSQMAIKDKFGVSKATVSQRIKNVEVVDEGAIEALRGKVSVKNKVQPAELSSDVKVKENGVKEQPVESEKLVYLSTINIEKLLERSRLFKGLDEEGDADRIRELRDRYEEKVRSLQVEVAGEIREKSRREANEHVKKRWTELILEASRVRLNRERRVLKADLEEAGNFVVLEEEKEWGQRPRPTRRTPRSETVLGKCLTGCPTPAYMIKKNFVEAVELCVDGPCYQQTRNEERQRKEQDKILEAARGGDREWLRILLFFITTHVRTGFIPEDKLLVDRWRLIMAMDIEEVFGWVLITPIEYLIRPRLGSDTVAHLRLQNWASAYYSIPRDYLLPKPETLPPELKEGAEEQEATI